MKPMLLPAVVVASLFTSPVRAEAWLSLSQYVDSCVLIVVCRAEPHKEGLRYKVEETWKGVYTPELFYHEPEEGYLITNAWHGNEDRKAGDRIILFFTAENQPPWSKGKLTHHSTAFPLQDDKLVYGSTSDKYRKQYSLADFRSAVGAQVRRRFAADVKQRIDPAK